MPLTKDEMMLVAKAAANYPPGKGFYYFCDESTYTCLNETKAAERMYYGPKQAMKLG